jgi:hypothetical protein
VVARGVGSGGVRGRNGEEEQHRGVGVVGHIAAGGLFGWIGSRAVLRGGSCRVIVMVMAVAEGL